MKWEQTELIWNYGLIQNCDIGISQDPEEHFAPDGAFYTEQGFYPGLYKNIHKGDVVFVRPKYLEWFQDFILPDIKVPIILLVSDGDNSFASECGEIEELIRSPYIYHFFVQNNNLWLDSKRFTSIPLGIDYHTIAYKGDGGWGEPKTSPLEQERVLLQIYANSNKPSERLSYAFMDFQHSDTMAGGDLNRQKDTGENRIQIFNKLRYKGCVAYTKFLKRSELWKMKSEYAFNICPHGAGVDTHRTWETLALGCIPIVKTSCLDILYRDLPVVIINEWDEIDSNNMRIWLEHFAPLLESQKYREILTNRYWIEKIREKVREIK